MTKADSRRPVWTSVRSGREYQAGIGPHAEDAAVRLTIAEVQADPSWTGGPLCQFLPYPDAPRQKCDLGVGDPLDWVAEVKMARLRGDNGKPDDTAIKDILSPYGRDRSALTDAVKLAHSGFDAKKAILIYGFDYPDRSLDPLIAAFERLANVTVNLGPRCDC